MNIMLARAGLFYRTVRHIPLLQLVFFIVRRVLPVRNVSYEKRNSRSTWTPLDTQLHASLPSPHPELMGAELVFLNVPAEFTLKNIDWRCKKMPKLWRYHLHYFDWLKDEAVLHQDAASSIVSWIKNNPVGTEDGWEPYTVSLRMVNWIKYFYRMRAWGKEIPFTWIESLEIQADWLTHNLEWHIKANHLFKNIVAMIWARAYFRKSADDMALQFYISMLAKELEEQFNSDGGHYERAPSYHALCIEDCIDIYNLLETITPHSAVLGRLRSIVENGLYFQRYLSFGDSFIALIGDSTLHGGHSWIELNNYWLRIGMSSVRSFKGGGLKLFKDSGFCVFKNANYELIISCGTASPSYQPGHSHCDVGSFELYLVKSGSRLLVDSGVSQYAAGPMRDFVRSSVAHNILTVDNQNQHEIWGEFRMGGRMKVACCDVEEIDGNTALRLEMQSHSAAEVPYIHVRTWVFQLDSILIRDQVVPANPATIDIRFNVHPDVRIVMDSETLAFEHEGVMVAGIYGNVEGLPAIEDSFYCPDFGVVQRSNQLRYSAAVSASASFDFGICIL